MTSTRMSIPSAQTTIYGNPQFSPQRMDSGAVQTPPRRIVLNMAKDVTLNTCNNAWKPGNRQRVAVDPEAQNTQEVLRKFRSILNKMTPEKFDRLINQVKELEITTEERLKGVVDLFYEKAISEPSFASMYAQMCCCLSTLNIQSREDPSSTVRFRSLVLSCCRTEFHKEGDVELQQKKDQLDSAASEDLQSDQAKARKRSIGNIKFIAELYRLQMIAEVTIHSCCKKLLTDQDEVSLEGLCQLLTTAGRDIDSGKTKLQMNDYFMTLDKIIREQSTSSRVRCLLQDVVELRSNNWVSRRAGQGPQTIQRIHQEAELEEKEGLRKVQQQLPWNNRHRAREQRESEQREREQREQRERQQRERQQRERQQRERQQREREQREREQREREQRDREQREREQREREQREREQRERAEGETTERQRAERETTERETTEGRRKERERTERERTERERTEGRRKKREERERQQTERQPKNRGQRARQQRMRKQKEEEKREREERERENEEREQKTVKMSQEELSVQLDRLLLDNTSSEQEIFDWVQKNLDESQRRSSPFLRALMTSVCRSAVTAFDAKYYMDLSVMDRRLSVLVKYLQSDSQQLQALSALQALDITLGHPPHLLHSFFNWLADNGVISADAFFKCQSSRDLEEHPGKKSLAAFLVYLWEAREELMGR